MDERCHICGQAIPEGQISRIQVPLYGDPDGPLPYGGLLGDYTRRVSVCPKCHDVRPDTHEDAHTTLDRNMLGCSMAILIPLGVLLVLALTSGIAVIIYVMGQ